jgi:putative intracellular protease/amidase
VTIASIKGGEVPFDEGSLNPPFLTKEAEKFILDDSCMKLVTNTVALKDVDPSSFDAIFLPGGHGTCVDFPVRRLLGHRLDQQVWILWHHSSSLRAAAA